MQGPRTHPGEQFGAKCIFKCEVPGGQPSHTEASGAQLEPYFQLNESEKVEGAQERNYFFRYKKNEGRGVQMFDYKKISDGLNQYKKSVKEWTKEDWVDARELMIRLVPTHIDLAVQCARLWPAFVSPTTVPACARCIASFDAYVRALSTPSPGVSSSPGASSSPLAPVPERARDGAQG